MKRGLIVSVQGYSYQTSLELSCICLNNGAIGIRTDIDTSLILKEAFPLCTIIGLKKIADEKYYITTSKEAIESCMWADYIAIDSRRGNQKIEFLYGICYFKKINIVSDVENIRDVEYILNLAEKNLIKKPDYFATTFAYAKKDYEKRNEIIEMKELTNIPIIAEGGIDLMNAAFLSNLVDNICIGKEITGIALKTKEFASCF